MSSNSENETKDSQSDWDDSQCSLSTLTGNTGETTMSSISTSPYTTEDESLKSLTCRSGSSSQRSRSSTRRMSGTKMLGRNSRRNRTKRVSRRKRIRTMKHIQKIKNKYILAKARRFMREYSKNDRFEAFTVDIDNNPYVFISLLNANSDLRTKYYSMPPPTPMKKSVRETSSSPRSENRGKNVRFSGEKNSSSLEPIELIEKISDAIVDTNRKYDALWADRTTSSENLKK